MSPERTAWIFACACVGCGALSSKYVQDAPAEAPPSNENAIAYCREAAKHPPDRRPPTPIVPPKVRKEVRAIYPPAALRERREGAVTLKVLIDARGDVSKAEIAASAAPDLDATALDAVKQFWFWPACLGTGEPVPAHILYVYRFVVPNRQTPTGAAPVSN